MTCPSLSESDLINLFCREVPIAAPDLLLGVGDDAAVISGPGESCWVMSCDACIEDVHFRRRWGLEHAGYKALARNVSDLIAMGARPRFFLQSISLPAASMATDAAELHRGLARCADEFNMILIGGDVSRSPSGISISITVIGSAARGYILRRCGARADDVLYVTGTLGEAALGWHCLEREVSESEASPWIERQLRPQPRIALGSWLANTKCVSSMIDVSDGLFMDVRRLAQASGCGVEISVESVPSSADFAAFAGGMGLDPIRLMLSGGDDYELAFSVSAAHVEHFETLLPQAPGRVTRIGSMVQDVHRCVVLDAHGQRFAIEQIGFDHFKDIACWA